MSFIFTNKNIVLQRTLPKLKEQVSGKAKYQNLCIFDVVRECPALTNDLEMYLCVNLCW